MKNTLTIVTATIFALTTIAYGQGWQVVYSEDFSSDPGWTTNSPARYYWHSGSEAYFMRMQRALTPWEYTRVPIGPVSGSFKLEYDVKLTGFTWAGDFHLGLFSPDMKRQETMIRGGFESPDDGDGIDIEYTNRSGERGIAHNYAPTHEMGVWYHAALVYDQDAQTINFDIQRKSDGANAYNVRVDSPGEFYPSDMTYLGASMDMLYPYSGRYAEGYIDNVTVSVPGPATLGLLALGGLAILRHRQRRTQR